MDMDRLDQMDIIYHQMLLEVMFAAEMLLDVVEDNV